MSKRTDSPRMGSLGSGAVTGLALAVQTGLAAVVGVLLAREIGRGPDTDGFFAAYGLYVVVVLAASAIRVTVLPVLALARDERRLVGETVAFASVVGAIAVPAALLAVLLADEAAVLLTGNGPEVAQEAAAATLPWMAVAAVLQLYAGLLASSLAALNDYVTAAAAYALGSVLGLLWIVTRLDDGLHAFSTGMAVNAAIAAGVPAVALGVRAVRDRVPATAVRPTGATAGSRLALLGRGVTLPLALQVIYLICLPFAAREGVGAVTSFSFAFLIGSAVVAVMASSLGLVTSVPLSRAGLDAASTVRHIVASSWLALAAVAATTGVFAVAGGVVVSKVLGSSFGDDEGVELGRVVVALTPWAVVAVGSAVAYPLVFVHGRSRRLPLLALIVLGVHVPLAWLGQETLGLTGIALALAASTAVGLAGQLAIMRAVRSTAVGLARAAAVTGALAAAVFLGVGLLLPSVAAAVAGVVVYGVLLLIVRPAGLVSSWAYLRALR